MNWICFRTANRREQQVARTVRQAIGIETFVPLISEPVEFKKKSSKRHTKALFPGYSFARVNLETQLSVLVNTIGVYSVLKSGVRTLVLSDQIIEEIKGSLNYEGILWIPDSEPRVDQMVEIIDGPIAGLIGKLVKHRKRSDRVAVLLEILGRNIPISVASSSVMYLNS